MCDVKTCTSLGVVFMLNYQYQYDCCGQMFFRLRFDDYCTNGTKTWSLVQSDREIQCSNHVCGLWYRNLWLLLYVHIMYTRVNKNPSVWNFLSPKPEVTCSTVAIIIQVVLLSPDLRIRAVSLSSIHYNHSHRVYINRRRQYICLIWN